jgi:hypothetical protein
MSFFIPGKIIEIWFLEKAPFMGLLTAGTIILYGKHPVSGSAFIRVRELIIRVAMRARTMAPYGRPLEHQSFAATATIPGVFPIMGFREFTTLGTNKNIFRVPSVFGKEKSGEEIELFAAVMAGLNFYPKEILDVGACGSTF